MTYITRCVTVCLCDVYCLPHPEELVGFETNLDLSTCTSPANPWQLINLRDQATRYGLDDEGLLRASQIVTGRSLSTLTDMRTDEAWRVGQSLDEQFGDPWPPGWS